MKLQHSSKSIAALGLAALLATGGAAACSSESGALGDTGVTADAGALDASLPTDGGTGPHDAGVVMPIAGGGTSGGAIAGEFTLFLLDEISGGPIEGATAVVALGARTLTATTSATGRADFSDAELHGAISVHVFAADYPFQTLIGLNARALTLVLRKDGVAPNPAISTISGTVSGFDLLPVPTSTRTRRFGVVTSLATTAFSGRLNQDQRPGGMAAVNVVLEDLFPDYAVKVVPEETLGLAVTGGILEQRRGQGPIITYTHLGVLPNLRPTASVLTGQDIAFTHALDRKLGVMLDAPRDLRRHRIIFELELADGGGVVPIAAPLQTRASTASFDAPTLTGALAGAGFAVVAIAEDMNGAQSMRIVHSADTATVTVGAFLPPPVNLSGGARSITAVVPASLTLYQYQLLQANAPVWNIEVLSGVPPATIALPDVPAGFTDPLSGSLSLSVTVLDFGPVDFGNARFDDLGPKLSGLASARADLTF